MKHLVMATLLTAAVAASATSTSFAAPLSAASVNVAVQSSVGGARLTKGKDCLKAFYRKGFHQGLDGPVQINFDELMSDFDFSSWCEGQSPIYFSIAECVDRAKVAGGYVPGSSQGDPCRSA